MQTHYRNSNYFHAHTGYLANGGREHYVRSTTPTWELLFTLVVSTDKGPVLKSSSSLFSSSSTEGLVTVVIVAAQAHPVCSSDGFLLSYRATPS